MYKEGSKAIDLAMTLDKMKGYKDQSLHLMECESEIIDEENIQV